jgi:tetratricopeptide (TPR) repeat protein
MPLLLLGGLELVLRLFGFGYPTSFFLPARIAGREYFITNEKFGFRFFPHALTRTPLPLRMASPKPVNEYRIFLFGESAAQGDPDPSFGAGRYLEVLLRERYPGTDFQVVCVAMTAINSHAILPIAHECAHHEGDLWIIYMGNNEAVGPFGAITSFGPRAPNRFFVRTALALKNTKIGQLIEALAARMSPAAATPKSWSGLNMFKDNKLYFDDPSRRRTADNFKANLEDILSVAHSARVPVVISTVASNLKDCAPFASLNSPNLTANQKSEWDNLYRAGTNSEARGDFPDALDSYQKAAAIDPHFAELQFRLGNCELALTNLSRALHDFELARDYDALPFRADTRINQIILDAARQRAGQGVHLINAAEMIAQASPGGIPGQELFYEHVHLDPAGNYLLARAFAGEIAKILPASIIARAKSDWAAAEYCDHRLALSPWDHLRLWQMNFSRVSEPPFTDQLNDVPRAKKYMALLDQLKKMLTPEAGDAARAMYRDAITAAPGDCLLHQNFAQFLEQIGSLPPAIAEQKRACECLPVYPGPQNKLGQLLVHEGKTLEAMTCFSNALALDKNFVPALNETGIVLANSGKPAEAAACFSRAQQLNPGYLETYFNWGFFEQSEGHLDKAIAHYQTAAQIQPNGPAAYFAQAVTAATQHRREESINHFHTTLFMYPGFWQARYLLGVELATGENVDEAQAQFREVTQRRPDFARAHLNLGVSFAKQGKLDDALKEFNVTVKLDPASKSAQQFIETTKALKARRERNSPNGPRHPEP